MVEKLTLVASREIGTRLLAHFGRKEMDDFWRLLDERVLQHKVMEKYLKALSEILEPAMTEGPDMWLLLCDEIAQRKTDPAYNLTGLIMKCVLPLRMKECLDRVRIYLSDTERWFSSDIYALHVVCEGLKHDFTRALEYVHGFVHETSVWTRRCLGIALHHYVQQVRNKPEKISVLLELLRDLCSEKDPRVAKGMGWGLRSVGEVYPRILIDFAKENLARKSVSKLLFRVAVAELPLADKEELLQHWLSVRGKG